MEVGEGSWLKLLGLLVKEWIAERHLTYSEKGSNDRKKLTIRVGKPYWVSEGVAACPTEWDGLLGPMTDMHGADLLQALHLAADADSLLSKLRSRYEFYFPGGEPYHDPDEPAE